MYELSNIYTKTYLKTPVKEQGEEECLWDRVTPHYIEH